jgi:hypothetical protein
MMRGWVTAASLCGAAALAMLVYLRGCAPLRHRPLPSVAPSSASREPVPSRLPPGFLKGQLHAHTGNSGDSHTPPARVHAWYEARGYDFVVFTDHSRITDTEDTRLLTFPGIELTENRRTCEPPPAPGDACLIHVNALFVDPARAADLSLDPVPQNDRVSIYARSLERARELGGIPMLNHPNMQYGANAEVLAELARSHGLTLLEVLNQAHDARNSGDASHPSTEKLWDSLLSQGFHVYATATDDAHHYDDAESARAAGEDVFVGDLGFVVVRAERNPAAIREAIERGDFYASTGVILSELKLDSHELRVAVPSGEARFEVIGRDGKILRTETGTHLSHRIDAIDGYVRLRITGPDGRLALTQPIAAAVPE